MSDKKSESAIARMDVPKDLATFFAGAAAPAAPPSEPR